MSRRKKYNEKPKDAKTALIRVFTYIKYNFLYFI